jgi:hypothetical protein
VATRGARVAADLKDVPARTRTASLLKLHNSSLIRSQHISSPKHVSASSAFIDWSSAQAWSVVQQSPSPPTLPSSLASAGVRSPTATASKSAAAALAASAALETGGSSKSKTLPFARQNVGASKRLTLDWVPVSLKSKSWNWLGRFATAARSPRLLCAYYPQQSSKKETGYDASRMPCCAAAAER